MEQGLSPRKIEVLEPRTRLHQRREPKGVGALFYSFLLRYSLASIKLSIKSQRIGVVTWTTRSPPPRVADLAAERPLDLFAKSIISEWCPGLHAGPQFFDEFLVNLFGKQTLVGGSPIFAGAPK